MNLVCPFFSSICKFSTFFIFSSSLSYSVCYIQRQVEFVVFIWNETYYNMHVIFHLDSNFLPYEIVFLPQMLLVSALNGWCKNLSEIRLHSDTHSPTQAQHTSIVCWCKWYIISLCVNGPRGLWVSHMCVRQASRGKWGPTTPSTTDTNRRNHFCASGGGVTQWVFLPTTPNLTPVGMLLYWEASLCFV